MRSEKSKTTSATEIAKEAGRALTAPAPSNNNKVSVETVGTGAPPPNQPVPRSDSNAAPNTGDNAAPATAGDSAAPAGENSTPAAAGDNAAPATNGGNGASAARIPMLCARSTRNMSLELPNENNVTATSAK